MMRKHIKTIMVFGLITFLLSSTIASSTYVKNSAIQILDYYGNILYVGGSGQGNYTTIQDAIDDASDGDTIFVYHGKYDGFHLNYKSVSIIGEDRKNTVITGFSSISNVGNIKICNFTYIDGIEFNDAQNSSLSNNNVIFSNSGTESSISLLNSHHCKISYNTVLFSRQRGIFIVGFGHHLITYNKIIANGFGSIFADGGIELCDTTENLITFNEISLNRCGVFIWDSINNTISNNNIKNNFRSAIISTNDEFGGRSNTNWDGNHWGLRTFTPRPITGIHWTDITNKRQIPLPIIEYDYHPSPTPF